jgi:DNA-binding transcriptional regulator YhcF (GntR family)
MNKIKEDPALRWKLSMNGTSLLFSANGLQSETDAGNAKFQAVARMVEERVASGSYVFRNLPSEMELAAETGVSRMTARKALQHLIDKGVLIRPRHARVQICPEYRQARPMQVAFLMPAAVSQDVQFWQWAVESTVAEFGGALRPFILDDWSDLVLSDLLEGFDGVFMMQIGLHTPPEVLQLISASPCPVVSLGTNLSPHSIPSISLFPPSAIHQLLDYLAGLGHHRIACLNTSPRDDIIERRIQDVMDWRETHDTTGTLIEYYRSGLPPDASAILAYEEVGRLLEKKSLNATALFCTTVWAAMGAIRAIREHGLIVGRDISVVAVNDEFLSPWLHPSLTALRMAEPSTWMKKCAQWMTHPSSPWRGPLFMCPSKIRLFEGDSTGPCMNGKR